MKKIHFNQIPALGKLLKSYFFAGILVLIPLGVIAWILAGALGALWRLHELLPDAWQPENYLPDPGLARLLNVAFVGEEIIQRIPVVRSVYSALDQLLRTLAAGGGQQFNRVVYVEYPRKGIWALAFVTGAAREKNIPEGHLNVYIPTTPNPTSGFHLIVPEADVKESGMTVEHAFKTILSLGIAQ